MNTFDSHLEGNKLVQYGRCMVNQPKKFPLSGEEYLKISEVQKAKQEALKELYKISAEEREGVLGMLHWKDIERCFGRME